MPFARSLLKSLCVVVPLAAAPAGAAEFMFQSTVDGKTIEGRPLAWTDHSMYLLARDGQLQAFDPHDAKNAKKTSPTFYGYSPQEMRQRLAEEFGNSMQITTTKHYVVVHPPGAASKWADHFEQLYRSFVAYFRVRGFQLEEPKFPLVAVVHRNKAEFDRSVQGSVVTKGGVVLGLYTPNDNRVNTYDITVEYPGQEWSRNADTIIHEATHQTAHNVGIHNRFVPAPLWLAEGLATMFEARGVWNAQTYHALKDRINAERYRNFQAGLKQRKPGTMGNLIASDRLFETDSKAAYAEAWAMMLFLCETRPRELAAFIQKTESRPDFSEYFASERVADFAECFGSDFKQLEANFLNWMSQLKSTVGVESESEDVG